MDIALSCPYEFGEAVYIARSLVGEEYPLSYEDFSMCEPDTSPPLKKDKPFVSNSKVYPIPSSGNITIELAEGSERIEVLSNEGKLMRVLEAGEGSRLEMNLPDGGIYYLQVYHQDGNVENKKVIIVK